MEDEEEEDEEEVMLEEEDMEAEPQIELKGVENADVSPGPSHPAGTLQPPDEEQAGLELLFLDHWQRLRLEFLSLYPSHL